MAIIGFYRDVLGLGPGGKWTIIWDDEVEVGIILGLDLGLGRQVTEYRCILQGSTWL